MKRRMLLSLVVVLLASLAAVPVFAAKGGRPAAGGMVYVTSQKLYYKTFVPVGTLPANGPFQQLFPVENGISYTEFGPGDAGYLGGRWWIDVNGNGEMDAGDNYLLCPLLGKGHSSPTE